MNFSYTVFDKAVLLLAEHGPSPGPCVSREMICHFEGRWRGIKFVLHLLEVSLHSFVAPQLHNTPPDKNPAPATHGVDCVSTDWDVCTRRVTWKLKISFWLFCSSSGMHRNRLLRDVAYPIFSTWKISGRMWFSSLCRSSLTAACLLYHQWKSLTCSEVSLPGDVFQGRTDHSLASFPRGSISICWEAEEQLEGWLIY